LVSVVERSESVLTSEEGAAVENFRDRFGLGWKQRADADYAPRIFREDEGGGGRSGSTGDPSNVASRSLEEALVFYTVPFLQALKSYPGKTGQLFQVADKINIKVDVAIPVSKFLLSRGYVTRMDEDKVGNDTLKLTEAGEMKLG
jgi:hypothetical protein